MSYLPLAAVAVRAGTVIRAGTPLGTVAAGHGGLHVGVRGDADRFGYVDPLALLPRPGRPLPAAPRTRTPTPAGRSPRPQPVRHRVPRVSPHAAPALPVLRRVAPRPRPAPWPVWAGLAVLLSGAAGSGTAVRRRRRRARSVARLAESRA